MYNFPQILANKKSLAQRRLIFGFGINDADYQVCIIINEEKMCCHFYRLWKNMIERCHSEKYLSKKPTYIGCSVSDDWRLFLSFKKWALTQECEGKVLDKDILLSGNKIYSSETCLFITNEISSLLNSHGSVRGRFPIGVHFQKTNRKYLSQCSVNGRKQHVGSFCTPKEASEAYLKFKSNHVHDIALQQTDNRLKLALIRISGEIARGEYYQ